ncbi:transcriptional regulator [Actinomadura nitritigenes]|uniref:transcriptional regulator n=1 Tax=Actinomadura nitritigenes TaxID=134602 RepID=UPI003D91EF89
MTGSIVLHALRCIDLAVAGWVTRSLGECGAWGLTEAGRAEDARRTVRQLEAAGTRDALTAAYRRFMVLNPELLELCSAWQLRTVDGAMAPNDRSDPVYDARVLNRFADLDGRAGAVAADLSAALPRFGRYRVRLTAALDRARSGALEHLTDSTTSYHTVWFQLHEDLLATLGIPRR